MPNIVWRDPMQFRNGLTPCIPMTKETQTCVAAHRDRQRSNVSVDTDGHSIVDLGDFRTFVCPTSALLIAMTRLFAFLGGQLAAFFIEIFQMFCYFVQCAVEMRHFYLYQHQIIAQCYAIGVGSLPLVCLISAFSGMAIAIQTAYQMEAYVPDYMVGGLIVRSVVLVLSPILIGLVLAGRVGAGVASELGTMKVSEQVDALTSMAVDPVGYLMLPRMLAGLIMIPILVIYSFFVAIVCGFAMSMIKMAITPTELIKGMKLYFMGYDVFVGLIKSMVYGGLLTFMGAYMGLCTVGGAQGVGQSATAAVVVSSALVLILDYFLTHALLY